MLSTRTPRAFLASLIVGTGIITAACGGSVSSAPPSETPSATASPTSAPSSQAPAASASAAGDVHPIAEALVEKLAADPLITHVEQTASVSTSDGTTTTDAIATMAADLSGDDLSLHLTVESDGTTALDQEMVVLGDTVYLREPGGEWQSAPSAAVADSIEQIFTAIRFVDDPSKLTYVGPEQVDGRALHHLTGSAIPYQPAAGGTGEYDAFDIWVEEDGTPVTMTSTFSATDTAGNEVTGETDLVFSKWGGDITIEAPAVE